MQIPSLLSEQYKLRNVKGNKVSETVAVRVDDTSLKEERNYVN